MPRPRYSLLLLGPHPITTVFRAVCVGLSYAVSIQ